MSAVKLVRGLLDDVVSLRADDGAEMTVNDERPPVSPIGATRRGRHRRSSGCDDPGDAS